MQIQNDLNLPTAPTPRIRARGEQLKKILGAGALQNKPLDAS